MQGLLELADLPYVGAGVLGSAVSMDKEMMKRVCRERNLPVVEFLTLSARLPECGRNMRRIALSGIREAGQFGIVCRHFEGAQCAGTVGRV